MFYSPLYIFFDLFYQFICSVLSQHFSSLLSTYAFKLPITQNKINYVCVCVRVHMFVRMCVPAHLFACVYVKECVCACAYMFVHICVYGVNV